MSDRVSERERKNKNVSLPNTLQLRQPHSSKPPLENLLVCARWQQRCNAQALKDVCIHTPSPRVLGNCAGSVPTASQLIRPGRRPWGDPLCYPLLIYSLHISEGYRTEPAHPPPTHQHYRLCFASRRPGKKENMTR